MRTSLENKMLQFVCSPKSMLESLLGLCAALELTFHSANRCICEGFILNFNSIHFIFVGAPFIIFSHCKCTWKNFFKTSSAIFPASFYIWVLFTKKLLRKNDSMYSSYGRRWNINNFSVKGNSVEELLKGTALFSFTWIGCIFERLIWFLFLLSSLTLFRIPSF